MRVDEDGEVLGVSWILIYIDTVEMELVRHDGRSADDVETLSLVRGRLEVEKRKVIL